MLILSNRTKFKTTKNGWKYGFINDKNSSVFIPQGAMYGKMSDNDWILSNYWNIENETKAVWAVKLSPVKIEKPTIIASFTHHRLWDYKIILCPNKILSVDDEIEAVTSVGLSLEAKNFGDNVTISHISKLVIYEYCTEDWD